MNRRTILSLPLVALASLAHGETPDPKPVGPPIPPAKPKPTRLHYDADHKCDGCGFERRSTPVKQDGNGWHTHECPKCGLEWWHADPK